MRYPLVSYRLVHESVVPLALSGKRIQSLSVSLIRDREPRGPSLSKRPSPSDGCPTKAAQGSISAVCTNRSSRLLFYEFDKKVHPRAPPSRGRTALSTTSLSVHYQVGSQRVILFIPSTCHTFHCTTDNTTLRHCWRPGSGIYTIPAWPAAGSPAEQHHAASSRRGRQPPGWRWR